MAAAHGIARPIIITLITILRINGKNSHAIGAPTKHESPQLREKTAKKVEPVSGKRVH
jgi:hypothetical protein